MTKEAKVRRLKVVAADDNADIRDLLAKRLIKKGYDVLVASDGEKALQLVREHRPDAVILDWMMPGVQGHRACKILKADPATTDIPVMLLTSRGDEGDVSNAFEQGADEYVTKPFDVSEIDQALRRMIGSDADQQARRDLRQTREAAEETARQQELTDAENAKEAARQREIAEAKRAEKLRREHVRAAEKAAAKAAESEAKLREAEEAASASREEIQRLEEEAERLRQSQPDL